MEFLKLSDQIQNTLWKYIKVTKGYSKYKLHDYILLKFIYTPIYGNGIVLKIKQALSRHCEGVILYITHRWTYPPLTCEEDVQCENGICHDGLWGANCTCVPGFAGER